MGNSRGRIFAQLSASGEPPGPLYRHANLKLQQGMVELALAYRIIDDRRWFLGDRWWVDPIIGLRTQINFTRWLFLALQGDVGGFGAGSQIAWFASGSIGVNFTRNVFVEAGYRYFFMDYENDGFTYDGAQSGLFMGVGLKL